jgi:hypothetical protein
MPIEDKDILQLDGTVIAGLLIFLTISVFETPSSDEAPPSIFSGPALRFMATFSMLIPFVLSATLLLLEERDVRLTHAMGQAARISATFGFFWILATLLVAILSLGLSGRH